VKEEMMVQPEQEVEKWDKMALTMCIMSQLHKIPLLASRVLVEDHKALKEDILEMLMVI
jgi:hypothetical protein